MNVAEKVSVTRPLVQVVDDDEALRNAAAWMLQGAGYEVRTYAAAAELLDALDTSRPCCVVSKEVDATETMIERVEERFALKPEHLAGDVAYGTGEMLG
jgi:FixJ family two-component response regulator